MRFLPLVLIVLLSPPPAAQGEQEGGIPDLPVVPIIDCFSPDCFAGCEHASIETRKEGSPSTRRRVP